MELAGKEVVASKFRPRDWHDENGSLILQERSVTRNWTWMENRWILIKGQRRKEFRIAHRIYSAAELSRLLQECGFGKIGGYGDLEGSPYDHTAKRLALVAKKNGRRAAGEA